MTVYELRARVEGESKSSSYYRSLDAARTEGVALTRQGAEVYGVYRRRLRSDMPRAALALACLNECACFVADDGGERVWKPSKRDEAAGDAERARIEREACG